MDYLKDDDDYIQLIANDYDSGSITHTEENAFNIIAVCECFREKALSPRSIIFDICLKYLDEIAYNRVVMEYITEFYHPMKDIGNTATKISEIWIAYFQDGRYGIYSERQICERFDISLRVAQNIIKVMESSYGNMNEWIAKLKKCGQKRLNGPAPKKLAAENKKYVDYDDPDIVDCVVERIIN